MLTMTGRVTASAWLRCPKCGVVYTKRKMCYNRKQADSWSAWMQKNYKGVCPDCYRASRLDSP